MLKEPYRKTVKPRVGATIVDQYVTIALAPEYKLPAAVSSSLPTAAGEVGQMAKEKVQAEEEHGSKEGGNAQTPKESQPSNAAPATTTTTTTVKPSNSSEPQGLIL
ncbi:hypothetical protein FEM48_Zijuj03G0199600 [Ziziphus jujuba var. spinosa]|uniref:Uncharacterized protein n=1 Tax=Ziziphus jujuba var. spinosa TaxID=714518 RepID=A0A978VSB5_ZIZJJ|nr:hypothetical protein FEM48_Zijuj03G0199600 [Ziziphus jujuba var. spinosa]